MDYSTESNWMDFAENSTDIYNIETEKNTRWDYVLNQVLLALIGFMGLCGNFYLIYIIARFSQLKTPVNIYIANLAIVDILSLIGVPVLVYLKHEYRWAFGQFLCKSHVGIVHLTQIASPLFLLFISIYRLISSCRATNNSLLKGPIFVSTTIWIFTGSYFVAFLLSSDLHDIEIEYSDACVRDYFQNVVFDILFVLEYILLISFFLISNFCIKFCCSISLTDTNQSGSILSNISVYNKHSETKLILTISVIYLACWFPFKIMQVILLVRKNSFAESTWDLVEWIDLLAFVPSAVNPILCYFLSDDFKTYFAKGWRCSCRNTNARIRACQEVEISSMMPLSSRD